MLITSLEIYFLKYVPKIYFFILESSLWMIVIVLCKVNVDIIFGLDSVKTNLVKIVNTCSSKCYSRICRRSINFCVPYC